MGGCLRIPALLDLALRAGQPGGQVIPTRGLTHIALSVRDAERTFRFYRDVFGVVAVYRDTGLVQAQTPGAWDILVFEEGESGAGKPGGAKHFGFRLVDPTDIDAAADQVERAGGKITHRGEFCPGEPYIFFRDPDDHEVEVWYEKPTTAEPASEDSQSASASTGRFLDLDRWRRREHFELYRHFANPFFNVCAELDVTELWQRSRAPGGPSFFLASVFLALRAANEVEALRTRVRGDRVWVHDQVSITPTVLRADETFAFARLEPAVTYREFETRSRPAVREACESGPLVVSHSTDDIIYQTTLPWVRFTSFSNALKGEGDSVPRVAFGKCSKDGDHWKLPVSVEVHHAVVDGLDVARFLEKLDLGLAAFSSE